MEKTIAIIALIGLAWVCGHYLAPRPPAASHDEQTDATPEFGE